MSEWTTTAQKRPVKIRFAQTPKVSTGLESSQGLASASDATCQIASHATTASMPLTGT